MSRFEFDLIWSRMTRVVSFTAGVGIMMYETVADHSDRPWLYAAAIGMMGLPLARAAEGVLSKFGSADDPIPEPLARPTEGPDNSTTGDKQP